MVFNYITCASEGEAKKLASVLLDSKAAGCVNIFPIHAMYRDGGKPREVGEWALIVKTIDSRVQNVEDVIREHHSYEIPCIATLSLSRMNREYKEWLTSEIA